MSKATKINKQRIEFLSQHIEWVQDKVAALEKQNSFILDTLEETLKILGKVI